MEGLRARDHPRFPSGRGEAINPGDDVAFAMPEFIRQGELQAGVLARPGQIGAAAILIGELP